MSFVNDVLAALDRIDQWRDVRAAAAKVPQLEERIAALESKLKDAPEGDPNLPICPLCSNGRLKTVAIKKDPKFAFAGLQIHSLQCTSCEHTEERQHDPNGRV